MEKRSTLRGLLLVFVLFGCVRELVPEPGVPRMTKEEVKALLGNPDVVIIDVRSPDDWNRSKEKIAGAVREDPEKEIKSWAMRYSKDKTLIFY